MRRLVLAALVTIWSANLFAQIQTNVPALKTVYAHDFNIGCILSYKHVGFPTDSVVSGQSPVVDPNGGYLVKYHMNSMSPGNNMKIQYTVDLTTSAANYATASGAARDSINVHPVIRFNGDLIAQLNWARRQGFTFRGHNLVWHSSAPTEFFRSGYITNGSRLPKDSIIIRMDNYIHEVIRIIHQGWPGLLSAMDVVNEAIDDNTGAVRTTGNEWYTTFGDSTYLMDAFQMGRKYTVMYGETQLKLYYNDYNTEIAVKADGIVRLLTPIFWAGYLDGIGMQEHDASSPSPFPAAADFITSYNKFYPICTEMSVTELDATTGSASPSASLLATQADQYGMLFKCFVERSYKSGRGKIISVSKDGLDDAYTFKTGQSSSLWDANDQCKPSFFAVADVGRNYNMLDSLISSASLLHWKDYTSASWGVLSAAMASAKSVKAQNFSASVSADTALGAAKASLKAAIDSLVVAVYTGAPVQVPTLLSPPNNAMNQPALITLSFSNTTDTKAYQLQVSTDPTFSAAASDSTGDTTNTVGPLTPGAKYYWRVRGISIYGNASFTSPDSFTVMAAPAVPVLYLPVVGATGQRVDTLVMKWHVVQLAAGYECQLSLSPSFSPLVTAKDSTTDTTFRAMALNSLTKYYWRVRSYNIGGSSAFSVTDSFTTIVAAPAVPTPLLPVANAQNQRVDSLVLKWSKVPLAAGYECQVSWNSSFTYLFVAKDSTTDTTFVLNSLDPLQKYCWRVRSFNIGGASSFSAPDSFITMEVLKVIETGALPRQFALLQNYPNPFNPSTTIQFALPERSDVHLVLYNTLGQVVKVLAAGVYSAGNHKVTVDGSALASGVYFYRLQAGSNVALKKLVLLK